MSLYIIFFVQAQPQFFKMKGRYCVGDYNTTENLDEAIRICEEDHSCALFHNDECDDTGPFRLCTNEAIINNSSFGNCGYLKADMYRRYDNRCKIHCFFQYTLYHYRYVQNDVKTLK